MPIDRELAFETLRRKHPEVYELYTKLRDKGAPYEEIENNIDVVDKLNLFLITWNVLDDMEQKGRIAIYNDYEGKRIILKKLYDSKIQYGVIE